MSADPVLVFADGVSVEPRALLFARSKLGLRKALEASAVPLQVAGSGLDCPISESGSLNIREVYQDGQVSTRGYFLPAYRIGFSQFQDQPFQRYDARIELTPDASRAGKLWVRLSGERLSTSTPSRQVRFDSFPGGRTVAKPTLLRGDEFRTEGILVSGAPQGTYCQDACLAAIVPAGTYANRAAGLTSASPGDPVRCNTVPIQVTFERPVRTVTVKFCGAAVVYTLKAFDPQGKLVGQADSQVSVYGNEYIVSSSAPDNRIVKIQFGHFSGAALTCVTEITFERSQGAEQITELKTLRHSVAVFLHYLASENPANPEAVATWKNLSFDEVLHREYQDIEATAHLRTLPEVDAVHRALSDPRAQCRLAIRCEADVVVRKLSQIYVPRRAETVRTAVTEEIRLFELPTATPKPAVLVANSKQKIQLQLGTGRPSLGGAANIAPSPVVGAPPAVVRLGPRPGILTHVAVRDPGALAPASPRPVTPRKLLGPARVAYPIARPDRINLGAENRYLVAMKLGKAHSLPSKFFADEKGEPAYTKARVALEQRVDLFFDPRLHPYIYPPRPPAGGAALVRHAVATDQVIFQDATQRHVFYFLPDEFRITRDEVRSPTYKPSMQIAFFSLTSDESGTSGAEEGVSEYGVQYTFRAVPHLAVGREADARRYIRDHALILDGKPAALLPLSPEWSMLMLNVPKEGGGTQSQERPDATVYFDKYIMDSIALSSNEFAEVFHSMRVGGETLNGGVKYRLPGSSVEQVIPFTGHLSKLAGPVLDAELVGSVASANGTYRIKLTNGIESKVNLQQAAVYLLDDPSAGNWVLCPLVAEVFPLELGPGESAVFDVLPAAPLAQAFDIRLMLTAMTVDLNIEELWRSVLDTPGWDDITQDVDVSMDASFFSGANALDAVTVTLFNGDEATIDLSTVAPRGTVKLIRPFLPYLMRQDTADDYFYRIESLRKSGPEGHLVKVAELNWTSHEGPALTVTPPLP